MVARETSLADEVAQAMFGAGIRAAPDHLVLLCRYAEILLSRAIPLGFLGPHEAERLVPRHLVESAALSLFIDDDARIVDVGSGAGLPGLVLACLGHPVDLVEATEKRADFLTETAIELGTVDATVHHLRAEDAGRGDLRGSGDAVVARAAAAPVVALELCLPLARLGGRVLIPTTPEAAGDSNLDAVASQLGGSAVRWEDLPVPGTSLPRRVMIVDKIEPTPERFPRRAGVPKRRPLRA